MAESSKPLPPGGPKARFFQYFQVEATALQEQMSRLGNFTTVGGERADAIDHCLAGIARLQKEVQDAASYTTAYDQRIYSQGIKALHEKLDETRAALMPKSKFSFKSSVKKNSSAISLSDAAELAMQQRATLPGLQPNLESFSESSRVPTPPPNSAFPSDEPTSISQGALQRTSLGNFSKAAGVQAAAPGPLERPNPAVRKLSFASSKAVDITSQTGVHVILPSSAAHATSSGSLTNLRHCIVDMSVPTATGQPFAALTIKNVKESLLICGNVNGSAHVTTVEDSIILVTTLQFRMHECKNCVVYLHVNSRPIIEDCRGIQFAPLPRQYYHATNNLSASNEWSQVQDFKWLRPQPSPNWNVLPKEDMIPDDTWGEIVPGGPDLSLDDILKTVGVLKLSQSSDGPKN